MAVVLKPSENVLDKDFPIRGGERLYSIDVFRAFTMMLMIFVNDLWTLEEYPLWLGHAAMGEDRLGLADVVFPAFLVIVGLSLPYAIQSRLRKGESKSEIFLHILLRSAALVIMGVFHVNLESYSEGALLSKSLWQILITLGFFMVWLDYPKSWTKGKKYVFQVIGMALLMVLAYWYEGGSPENPTWMRSSWYGILGLIGWAYFICATVYLLTGGKFMGQVIALLFFLAFNAFHELGWLEILSVIRERVWIVGNGAMPAFTMAGVLVSIYYRKNFAKGRQNSFWIFLLAIAMAFIIYGLLTRPIWGIHKIGDSPSWVAICIGLSWGAFGFFVWLVDVKAKGDWFRLIRPAGTSTLTCYLLPYIHYALFVLLGISLPEFLRTGLLGIVKCLVYALVIIIITGFLEKRSLRLKV